MNTESAGKRGEDAALSYLEGRGYVLLARNWRYARREIDLIMRDGDTTVFVEVKARSSVSYGTPAAFVDARKRRLLTEAAQAYLIENGLYDAPARFDVVEVYLSTGTIRLLENAF